MNTLPAGDLLALFLHFLTLSLLSIGGAMSTAPEMQRYFVVERGWIGEADFTTAIALAQAAPGPNVLFVPVLGFQAAGLPGAAAAHPAGAAAPPRRCRARRAGRRAFSSSAPLRPRPARRAAPAAPAGRS